MTGPGTPVGKVPVSRLSVVRSWLARALGDTLARRIFLLLWVTLVVAQVLAIGVVQWSRGSEVEIARLPTAPSLPPMPGLMRGPGPDGMRQPDSPPPRGSSDARRNGPDPFQDPGFPGNAPDFGQRGEAGVRQPGESPWPRPNGNFPGPFRGLSTEELMLDYGIRLLVTGLAAWLASRWLARPMRQLVGASQALGRSLERQEPMPLLNEHQGTLEVRETARVFNAMARQLQRQFNERGLMVAAISHDLRTPLTRLRMRLESLEIEEIQRLRSVEDIHEMNALVDAVMELFRGDSPGSREPAQDLDLVALAQAVTDDLVEQGQPVTFASAEEAVLAKVQPLAMRRVLGNLVGNALRYGGQAEVQAGRDAQGAWIRILDNGPGIPAAKLEEVFAPFFRLEDSRNRHTGGVGLGLYIARELTQRQGGEVTLSNRPEGGLMAEIRLP